MLSWIDTVTIFASLGLVVYAVTRASNKGRSGSEYFLAGRDLSWPFIGMSLFASNISAEHVLGLAGDGYRIGMVAGGYEWVSGWDLIVLAMFFAPLYLREKIFTIPEFVERRYGWPLRAFLSANLLVINVFTKNAIDIGRVRFCSKSCFWVEPASGDDFALGVHGSLYDERRIARGGLCGYGAGDVVNPQQCTAVAPGTACRGRLAWPRDRMRPQRHYRWSNR